MAYIIMMRTYIQTNIPTRWWSQPEWTVPERFEPL